MKIKLKEPLKNLKGDPLENVTVGEALGNVLVSSKMGGKMKLYVLATACASKDSVELDAADLELARQAVEGCEIYNALVCGQLLVLLSGKQ